MLTYAVCEIQRDAMRVPKAHVWHPHGTDGQPLATREQAEAHAKHLSNQPHDPALTSEYRIGRWEDATQYIGGTR